MELFQIRRITFENVQSLTKKKPRSQEKKKERESLLWVNGAQTKNVNPKSQNIVKHEEEA